MPRVRTIEMDGFTCKISPLSFDEADAFITESKEMIARDPKPTNEEWVARTLKTVCLALNKAEKDKGKEWTSEILRKELDSLLINHIFSEFLIMSGVTVAKPGEK